MPELRQSASGFLIAIIFFH